MGNEAIALGALAAGVNLVAGYPGTPSSEVLETVAKRRGERTYVEWSVNEKTAMELAAGASYAGARAMVTMKQMGLNVASDPLMCLEYIGVKGGLVVLVADDPGPISSQTEQDTRHFSRFSKLPCFDPCSAQEAYWMVQEAFDYSEKYATPVFLRPTTRVCHGYASVELLEPEQYRVHCPDGFVKDSSRWVIFPRLSYQNHLKIEARNREIAHDFSTYARNQILPGEGRRGIAAGGVSVTYAVEALRELGPVPMFKVATPHPFPEELALAFLKGLDEVLCLEELDPVIERELTYICGKHHLRVRIRGKLTGDTPCAGENSRDGVSESLRKFLGLPAVETAPVEVPPPLPVRPPVLCAGCPHRASFYAVKRAMRGRKTLFCGDIGCYTLGNAMPLDMVDTCLCMGAGLGIAQGVGRVEPDTACFAFVGDSTFFASAIPSTINALHSGANMTLVVLDNSTTAMTGHQPHPGTGRNAMGEVACSVSIEAVLRGIGLDVVEVVNPLELKRAIACVQRVAAAPGVKAIIFRAPCIALFKPSRPLGVDAAKCVNCQKCIRELGCPALVIRDGGVHVDDTLCNGCGLCAQVCPTGALAGGERE